MGASVGTPTILLLPAHELSMTASKALPSHDDVSLADVESGK